MADEQQERRAADYGRFYWCVVHSYKGDSATYYFADRLEVSPSGALILWRDNPEAGEVRPNVIFPAGEWVQVHAASVVNGLAVAMDYSRLIKKES